MSGNRGKGRPLGSQNKTTRAVKEALAAVYVKRGGDKALLTWSQENPTEFYKLWGRLLPVEMQHAGPEGGKLVVTWQPPNAE